MLHSKQDFMSMCSMLTFWALLVCFWLICISAKAAKLTRGNNAKITRATCHEL